MLLLHRNIHVVKLLKMFKISFSKKSIRRKSDVSPEPLGKVWLPATHVLASSIKFICHGVRQYVNNNSSVGECGGLVLNDLFCGFRG